MSMGKGEGFDPEPYKRALAARVAEKQARIECQVQAAREFLPGLRKAFLAIDPGLRFLALFGSLATGRPSHEDFDIDLAVRSDRYLKLVAWALDQPWKIDLVDLDGVPETILEGIEKDWEVLYESQ